MTGEYLSDCADATEEIGAKLASALEGGDLLLLQGDLAAGKTTFVRGLVRGLGGDPAEVSSPSFVLIQTYGCDHPKIHEVHHVDLYRLGDQVDPLREIGIEELLSEGEAVVVVEWPRDSLLGWVPRGNRPWQVRIEETGPDSRRLSVDRLSN